MKYINRKNWVGFIISSIALLFASSCEEVLDRDNLAAISPNVVFTDYKVARAYMDNVADKSLPEWPLAVSAWSDEVQHTDQGGVSYGQANQATNVGAKNWNTAYQTMRMINVFIAEMEDSPIETQMKNGLVGQAYFWRAYNYFEMVKVYGGVPYLKHAQTLSEDLFVKRNKTSECFNFIAEDLDKAIELLPEKYTGDEAGKINRASAYALKGRVMLYRASPQFNPTGNATLWTDAFNANKAAYDWLIANGYGLYPDFANVWFNELNKEVIFVTRYNNPEKVSGRARACRPQSEIINAPGPTQPTQELVEAFPMNDGTPITEHPDYDLSTYTQNRDPRFYATVVNNGDLWELGGKAGRIQWTYKDYDPDGFGRQWGTRTGYFCRKAVPTAPTRELAGLDGTDWIEIRFAEVMLNYAEAANQVGNQTIAYDMLKAIRQRAGILPGDDSMYGLKSGMTQEEMLKAIMLERQIELAFEGKRFWDLRRLRWLQDFNGKSRHGLVATPINPSDLSVGFTYEVAALDIAQKLNYPESYYFFPIPESELRNNPNMAQTDGWNEGGFNPVE